MKNFISAAVLLRVNTAYRQWLAILNEPQKHLTEGNICGQDFCMQWLLEERKSPWAITLLKPVSVAFECDIPLSDRLEGLSWPIRSGEFRASGNDSVSKYRGALLLYSQTLPLTI